MVLFAVGASLGALLSAEGSDVLRSEGLVLVAVVVLVGNTLAWLVPRRALLAGSGMKRIIRWLAWLRRACAQSWRDTTDLGADAVLWRPGRHWRGWDKHWRDKG